MTRSLRPSKKTSSGVGVDRRQFLLGAGAGITLTALPFSFANAAAAQVGSRSLVCIFLMGGADSANMFVPLGHGVAGQTYDTYRATRGPLALPTSELLPVGDGDFGMNAGLPGLAALSNEGRVAVVTNVGPLARPTTQADVEAERTLPQTLFAHDAQQKLWQTGRSRLTSSQGWGGAMSAVVNSGAEVAPSFSISGSNIWQSAQGGPYSRLSSSTTIRRMAGFDASLRAWIPSFEGVEQVMRSGLASAAASPNRLDQVIGRSIGHSIITTEQLEEATEASAANDVGMNDIGGNRLAAQLRVAARLIRNRESLGMPRQVFFVRMGGWDTHGQQAQRLPVLLEELNGAITSFQRALDGLGVADSVTTFTASDFGRTLTSNGDGTDHGWGGHAFVFGGAVQGGRYGTVPSYVSTNNPDDTGGRRSDFAGRWIPTTSVAQHGATLARWMGLDDSQLDRVFPELRNFGTRDLGFLS